MEALGVQPAGRGNSTAVVARAGSLGAAAAQASVQMAFDGGTWVNEQPISRFFGRGRQKNLNCRTPLRECSYGSS